MKLNHTRLPLVLSCAAAVLLPLTAAAGESSDTTSGDSDQGAMETMKHKAGHAADRVGDATSDLRMHAVLEARLAENDELSAFMINTDVQDGVAHLQGEVKSEAQRELAAEVALGVDGVTAVRNDLTVTGGEPTIGEKLAQTASDATVTAKVKSRLLASENTSGLSIDVDTEEDVVTLTGEVDSETEAELAGLIAANTAGVEDVRNELRVGRD